VNIRNFRRSFHKNFQMEFSNFLAQNLLKPRLSDLSKVTCLWKNCKVRVECTGRPLWFCGLHSKVWCMYYRNHKDAERSIRERPDQTGNKALLKTSLFTRLYLYNNLKCQIDASHVHFVTILHRSFLCLQEKSVL
jgi:hypothetical protein